MLVLPLRINHGFLKPCFQAPGTLAEWFPTHLYIPVSYKTDISGMEKGGNNKNSTAASRKTGKCKGVGVSKRQTHRLDNQRTKKKAI